MKFIPLPIMIEQFQTLLASPKHNSEELSKQTQDLILNALQAMFPAQYDFSELAKLYENPQVTVSQQMLTYHLVQYFIGLVSENFVSIHSYSSLEMQTQKLEATIRSHIKLEQEVKMYLEHLESKIAKYETYIQSYLHASSRGARPDEHPPSFRETDLLRERLSLIRRNQALMNRLNEKEELLRKMNKLNSSHLEIMEDFMEKDKLIISKSENKLSHVRMYSESKSSKTARDDQAIVGTSETDPYANNHGNARQGIIHQMARNGKQV